MRTSLLALAFAVVTGTAYAQITTWWQASNLPCPWFTTQRACEDYWHIPCFLARGTAAPACFRGSPAVDHPLLAVPEASKFEE